jgi:hypothetical protein
MKGFEKIFFSVIYPGAKGGSQTFPYNKGNLGELLKNINKRKFIIK